MFGLIGCIIITYVSLTAHWLGIAPLVHAPVIAAVLVARWLSPLPAMSWAFGIGFLLDGIGSGPLGVQAAALTFFIWLVWPMVNASRGLIALRLTLAILITTLGNTAVGYLAIAIPDQRWELLLVDWKAPVLLAMSTATVSGVVIGLGQRLCGFRCTTP